MRTARIRSGDPGFIFQYSFANGSRRISRLMNLALNLSRRFWRFGTALQCFEHIQSE